MLSFLGQVIAGEVTYSKHIKPIWDKRCSACHDSSAPYYGEFKKAKKEFKAKMKGPRMDTYADLLFFVGWPDSGALMRRLDDGSNTKEHKPGNMYLYLGNTDRERKKNLFQFKAWVGKGAWNLNRWSQRGDVPGITKEQIGKIKVKY
jgi:hypothetical protein